MDDKLYLLEIGLAIGLMDLGIFFLEGIILLLRQLSHYEGVTQSMFFFGHNLKISLVKVFVLTLLLGSMALSCHFVNH